MRWSWTSLFALFAASGCIALSDSEQAAHVLGKSTSPIVGGFLDRWDPAIVGISVQRCDGTVNICTGTIVSPTVVLTAAHCVATQVVGDGATFTVTTARNLNDRIDPRTTLRVHTVQWDRAYDPEDYTDGHDIGILWLTSRTDIEPMPINRLPLVDPEKPERVRIIGYGRRDPLDSNSSGIKRYAMTEWTGLSEQFVIHGTESFGTCAGDSGGPVLYGIGGREHVIGVTSWGGPDCQGSSFSTRTDTSRAFLDRYIGFRGAGPPALEGACAPDAPGGRYPFE